MEAGIDNMTVALAEHNRIGRLHSVDHTVQVDVQDTVPVLNLTQPYLSPNRNAGIVEHIVQPTLILGRRPDELVYRGEVCDIQFDRGRLTAPFLDAGRDLLGKCHLTVG